MGLCLSKKDVLIQKPRQILHDHGRAFVPNSPASTSIISGDSSSIAEKQLLKNSSIGSSCTLGLNRSSVYSNTAECGSRSSLGFGRYSSAAAATFEEDLDQSEARTSGFSYLSSPMIEGIDVSSSGLDQSVARKRFELDGGLRGDPIDEELEGEDFDEGEIDECGLKKQQKKPTRNKKSSQMKSLHVFGEVFGENVLMGRSRAAIPAIPTIRMASICENGKQKTKNGEELAVFGTEDHYFRSMNVFSKPKNSISSLSSSKQSCGDSEDLSLSEDSTTLRSARWGFCLDSSGSDEMEGDDEASRVSSCSTQIEPSICKINGGPFCDSSSKPAFMAVPPLWQHSTLNFSYMNPGSRAAAAATGNVFAKNHQNESLKIHAGVNRRRRSSDETTTMTDSSEDSNRGPNLNSNLNSNMRGGFVRGFAAMPLQGSLLMPKFNPATGGAARLATTVSSSSSLDSTIAEDQDEDRMQKQTNPKQAPGAATISKQQLRDHDYDSDSSNDLFEIENLGAALGSLSSPSDKEKFVYPMNSAFLKDPDISHSTTIKLAPTPARNFQFQSAHSRASGVASKSVGILGPTLRANVAMGKQTRLGTDLLQGRKNFSWSRPQKKKSTANATTGHLENETDAFYEIR